ncbi:RNA polymerase sigma factor [Caulobacter sp. ErkDOM-YI]|uniref:RNA polymerase sigma factor n=1 Tax=unclassified Caulobacter TaxID=2648921 RepID=UPI003AF7C20A
MSELSTLSNDGDPDSAGAAAQPSPDDPQVELAILLMRVSQGDRAAFKTFYDNTNSRLMGLAVRILSRRDAAEDVVQEAYVRVWLHAGKYDPLRGAPMPWIWKILRNALIDRLRRDRALHEDLDDYVDRLPTPEPPTAARLDLTAGLTKLGPSKARVLGLAFVEGHTHEEIADDLNIPLGTLKSQIRRSLEQLRRHLDDD